MNFPLPPPLPGYIAWKSVCSQCPVTEQQKLGSGEGALGPLAFSLVGNVSPGGPPPPHLTRGNLAHGKCISTISGVGTDIC